MNYRPSRVWASISGMLVAVLLVSFALHAVQVPHQHAHGPHGDVQQDANPVTDELAVAEYAHQADKKLFLLLVLIGLGAGVLAVFQLQPVLPARVLAYERRRRTQPQIVTPFDVYMFSGLLNPKLH